MHFGPIFGILLAITLVLGTILTSTNNYFAFIHFQGLLVVFGGTFACAFLSYPLRDVKVAIASIREIGREFEAPTDGLSNFLEKVIEWAYIVQSKGFPGLEQSGHTEEVERDPILRYALELAVTDYKPEEVQKMIETAADGNFRRNILPAKILHNMASSGPAFGMVGTLIGMVIMLGTLESDISKIASGLSMALLATLYGLLSARLIYLPAAEKLLHRENELRVKYYLMAEGLSLLLSHRNPHAIVDRLNSYIDPNHHFDLSKYNATLKKKNATTA